MVPKLVWKMMTASSPQPIATLSTAASTMPCKRPELPNLNLRALMCRSAYRATICLASLARHYDASKLGRRWCPKNTTLLCGDAVRGRGQRGCCGSGRRPQLVHGDRDD